MSETLQERIMRHEGFTSVAKMDVAPMMVIGFGHDITQEQAANDYLYGITYGDAVNLLEADIARCVDQADANFPWFDQLNPLRQDVLLEQIFQLGINRVLGFHHELAALAAGDYARAADEMTNSEWNRETPARCQELAALMRSGVDNC